MTWPPPIPERKQRNSPGTYTIEERNADYPKGDGNNDSHPAGDTCSSRLLLIGIVRCVHDITLTFYSYHTPIAIHYDALTTVDALGCHTCSQHGGDMILARDDGAMAEYPAYIRDNA